MEECARSLMVGAVVATVVLLAYYPAVVAVGLLSYAYITPPPAGPTPSELAFRDGALSALSYPSRVLFGAGGRSAWSPVNPVAHALLAGLIAGAIAEVASLRTGRLPLPRPKGPPIEE